MHSLCLRHPQLRVKPSERVCIAGIVRVAVRVLTFGTGDLTSFSSAEHSPACTSARWHTANLELNTPHQLMHVSIRNDPVLRRAETMTYLPQRELERRGAEGVEPRRDQIGRDGGMDGRGMLQKRGCGGGRSIGVGSRVCFCVYFRVVFPACRSAALDRSVACTDKKCCTDRRVEKKKQWKKIFCITKKSWMTLIAWLDGTLGDW